MVQHLEDLTAEMLIEWEQDLLYHNPSSCRLKLRTSPLSLEVGQLGSSSRAYLATLSLIMPQSDTHWPLTSIPLYP